MARGWSPNDANCTYSSRVELKYNKNIIQNMYFWAWGSRGEPKLLLPYLFKRFVREGSRNRAQIRPRFDPTRAIKDQTLYSKDTFLSIWIERGGKTQKNYICLGVWLERGSQTQNNEPSNLSFSGLWLGTGAKIYKNLVSNNALFGLRLEDGAKIAQRLISKKAFWGLGLEDGAEMQQLRTPRDVFLIIWLEDGAKIKQNIVLLSI